MPSTRVIACAILSGSGAVTAQSFAAEELVQKARAKPVFASGMLRARDLALLDLEGASITVRRLCVLINYGAVKGLILAGQVILLFASPASAHVALVHARLVDLLRSSNAFELCALEAILSCMSGELQREFNAVKARAQSAIVQVMDASTSVTLDLLREAESALRKLQARAAGCRKALNELLQDDEYRHIAFARALADPERFMGPNAQLPDNAEGEMIVELALQYVNSTLLQTNAEYSTLEAAEINVQRTLAAAQNKIAVVRVVIQAAIGSCACSTMVSAIFAMNLASGIANMNVVMFWVLAWLMIVLPVLFTVYCWRNVRAKR